MGINLTELGEDRLHGRDQEIAALKQFLRLSAERGGPYRITGEPGLGKTALLNHAAAEASADGAWQVLRAAGVEYEAEVSFSGLNQLMLPVVDSLPTLPGPQRNVLRTVLGIEAGDPPNQLQTVTALLSWFNQLGRTRPLLVVVDDFQWLDRASALTLSLVARRLEGPPVALLIADRDGSGSFLDERTETLKLGALDDADALQLLAHRNRELHPSVRQRIVNEAAGNPLALLELPRALTADEEQGSERLPTALRLTDRLRDMFAARVEKLPESTRDPLLLAALNGRDGIPLEPLIAGAANDIMIAEREGLVWVDPRTQRLRFKHPLTRAATVQIASPSERRAAHRRLAELATDPVQEAVHLGEAAFGYDEHAADGLQRAGRVAVSRGDIVQAVAHMIRAAELSADRQQRARRLSEAAYLGANFSGSLVGAHALLEQARLADPDTVETLNSAAAAAAHLLNSDGDIDTAHRILVAALAQEDGTTAEAPVVEAAVTTLMAVCTFGGRPILWEALDAAVDRFSPLLPTGLRLSAITFGDPARASLSVLRQLDELVEEIDGETNPVRVLQVGLAGHYVDRLPRGAVERVIADARQGGAIAAGVNGLILLAVTAYFEGRWSEAVSLADECIDWCRENGYALLEWGALDVQMLIAAARGERQFLRTAHERMQQWAIPRKAFAVQTFTSNTEAMAALADARFNDAHAIFTSIAPPGEFPDHGQLHMWSVLDVVEAAVCSANVTDARTHLAAASNLGFRDISPRLRFLIDGAAAMTADDAHYRPAFERVTEEPDASRWPFHLARLELAFGDRLRRDREMRRARTYLQRAADRFSSLDATPWRDRAVTALRSTGHSRRGPDSAGGIDLTPQEHEIARLAATGMTNRQIASRLFLSPRTVGGHLYRVFPKLGITTRAALRDALTQHEHSHSHSH
jgi:DNA-binding CsgD family transcriptional regulator